MAHYAEVDKQTNIVQRVVVVSNELITLPDGNEDESIGSKFLSEMFPNSGYWIRTSYNHNKRKMYAGIGYRYVPTDDVFLPPAFHSLKEYEDFVLSLNNNSAQT